MKMSTNFWLLAASLMIPFSAGYASDRNYAVTITNVTPAQTFTPILVAAHRKDVQLFDLGAAASSELEAVAEGGDIGPLSDQLAMDPAVGDLNHSGGLLGPGESVTVEISAGGSKFLSLVAMLVPTNDTIVALSTARLPRRHQVKYWAYAYDAGTEINDELCASIPGGADCHGEALSPETGEGFVHISNGIHGIGDLDAAVYDWNNPVALVRIERIRSYDD